MKKPRSTADKLMAFRMRWTKHYEAKRNPNKEKTVPPSIEEFHPAIRHMAQRIADEEKSRHELILDQERKRNGTN